MKVYIFLSDEIDYFAWLAHTSCSTNSLQIFLGRLCIFKLNYMADIHRVQTSRSQVITNKDRYFPLMKQIQGPVTHFQRNLLRLIKRQIEYVSPTKLLTNQLDICLGIAKDHYRSIHLLFIFFRVFDQVRHHLISDQIH